ncbi:hypothetical protein RIVM261_015270 [Rivularia sp. IAM M-261]|nr:hypothetical protein RIVM261_015270 [Rivularia sp. IAM M-261]
MLDNNNTIEKYTILASQQKKISVTIVIPALNEEGNLEKLLLYIKEVFQNLGSTLPVLIVNDGSTDNSPEILNRLTQQYNFLKVIHHSQKRGVTEVWKTALVHVKTDWILWGQADLESDPRTDIPLLLEACKPGVDAVAGWRQKRGDGKIIASMIANSACRLLFGLKIHDMNWIKLVRHDLLSTLPIEKITHRYLLAVLASQGHNVTEVATPWHPRHSGKSKFGKRRLLSSAIDFVKLWWWLQTEKRKIYKRNMQQVNLQTLT